MFFQITDFIMETKNLVKPFMSSENSIGKADDFSGNKPPEKNMDKDILDSPNHKSPTSTPFSLLLESSLPTYEIQVSDSLIGHIKVEPSLDLDSKESFLYHDKHLIEAKIENLPNAPEETFLITAPPELFETKQEINLANCVNKSNLEITINSKEIMKGTLEENNSAKSAKGEDLTNVASQSGFHSEKDVNIIDLTDDTIEIHTNVKFSSKKKKKKKKRKKKKGEEPVHLGSDLINPSNKNDGKIDDFIIIENVQFDDTTEIPPLSNNMPCLSSDRPKRKRQAVNYSEYLLTTDNAKDIYECNLCSISFETQDLLDTHNKEHLQTPTPHSCTECGRTFQQLNGLKRHQLIKHNAHNKLFHCRICTRSFQSVLKLNKHKKACKQKQSLNQNDIKTDMSSLLLLKQSTETLENKSSIDDFNSLKLKCPEPDCMFQFSTLRDYKRHARGHSEVNPYPCPQCGKHFSEWGNLIRHLKSHFGIKSFQCSYCDKRFCEKSAMVSHTRHIHTGEKPYSCHLCDKAFATRSDLNRHFSSHSSERKYECTDCGKKFKQRDALVSHMRRKTGVKQWQCGVCGKNFAVKGGLKAHMLIHSEYKLYRCEICGKESSHHTGLKEHMRTHTGEFPYSCKICGRRFSFRSNRNRHEKTVHV